MIARGLHSRGFRLTAATMLVLVLIISFDWPFRGNVQVDASMFNRVMENMQALDGRGS